MRVDLNNAEIIQSLGEGDMPGAIRHASIAMKQANAEQGTPAGGRSEQNDPQ